MFIDPCLNQLVAMACDRVAFPSILAEVHRSCWFRAAISLIETGRRRRFDDGATNSSTSHWLYFWWRVCRVR